MIAKCGHESKRSKQECYSCARKRYYHTNPEAKQKIKNASSKWQKENKKARKKIVDRWLDNISGRPPRELKELWKANKYLERALEFANKYKRISNSSK